jgi:hypothetical protein
MNIYSVIFLIIFSIIIIIPVAHAQTLNENSNQKSIQVTISLTGEMHVIHVVKTLDAPSQIDLIDGTISNLSVKDQEGNDVQYGSMNEDNSLMILPSNNEVIIEYDLGDKLILKDNVWTLDFLYLDKVSFIFPKQADLIFVDSRPAYLGEKNGILCHGCQMIEVRTWAEINQFSFDPTIKGINFQVIGENPFVTTIVPIDFLAEPYQVFLDDEKIIFQDYINNGTHVWLTMRPQNSGEISIIGSIVPEITPPSEYEFAIIGIAVVGIFFFKRKK